MESKKKKEEYIIKLIETIETQNKAFQENTINKDCKSKIYELINDTRRKLENIEEVLKGDNYNIGMVNRIKIIEEKEKQQEDYINQQRTIFKIICYICSFLGTGNIILFINFILNHWR